MHLTEKPPPSRIVMIHHLEADMRVAYKEDWEEAERRMDAWCHGQVIDRVAMRVTAPREGLPDPTTLLRPPQNLTSEEVVKWYTDENQVIPRLERYVANTFWGGEAFPVIFPVSVSMVAILAAYLGCPYELHAESGTAWAYPIIQDWKTRPHPVYDPENLWWQRSKTLLDLAAQRGRGRYYVGLPDLNGPSEILARMRGSQELAIDLIENPQPVIEILGEINQAWYRYWQAAVGVIHQWMDGYFHWMGLWSDRPAIDLQSDFSCLISPQMFETIFLPFIEQQTHWVERTIYHLDGPDAVRHLDALLALPELDGIQWVQGAGAPPASAWIRLLRRIQSKGKLVYVYCEPWEVETLLAELEPEGLILNVHCCSEAQARDLLQKAGRWSAPKQWLIPKGDW